MLAIRLRHEQKWPGFLFWPTMYVRQILLPREAAHIARLLMRGVMVGAMLAAPHCPGRGPTKGDICPDDATKTAPVMM